MLSRCAGITSSLKNMIRRAHDWIEMKYVRRKYSQLKKDKHFLKGMLEEFGVGCMYACRQCEMDCRDFKEIANNVKLWKTHGFWAYKDCKVCCGLGVVPIPMLELGKDSEYEFDQSQIR